MCSGPLKNLKTCFQVTAQPLHQILLEVFRFLRFSIEKSIIYVPGGSSNLCHPELRSTRASLGSSVWPQGRPIHMRCVCVCFLFLGVRLGAFRSLRALFKCSAFECCFSRALVFSVRFVSYELGGDAELVYSHPNRAKASVE